MSSSFIGKVLDNYRIIERLGTGGMGVVFKAIHIKLDKVVAVKIISPSLAMNENFLSRFESEAKALAKLEDPNIVRIYDLRSDNDRWFIVMEYVEGTTLALMTEKYVKFPWKKCLPLFKQMLSAIAHAHESGIIHRDIKPNNIMLTDHGIVKVTDFGLAKDTTISNTMTVTSGGTLHYMSPEHVKGFSFIDARSDIYSLGMTFYEMLTGTIPFKDLTSDFDIREAIVRKEFDKPSKFDSKIPREVDELIMKAIRKNPDERFQSADEMIEAIEDIEIKNKLPVEQPQHSRRSSTSRVTVEKQKAAVTTDRELSPEEVQDKKRKKFPFLKLSAAAVVILLLVYFFPQLKTHLPYFSGQKNPKIESPLLSITTNPVDATVFLNGDSIGRTPLQKERLHAGNYNIKITKHTYTTHDTSIELKAAEHLDFQFTLQKPAPIPKKTEIPKTYSSRTPVKKEPQFSSIIVRTDPSGASVHLNGRFRGNSPLNLSEINPGSYLVEASLEGYETYTENIRLSAGNTQVLQPRLRPYTGQLLITTTPEFATVILDGQNIPRTQNPVDVPTGTHRIEVKNSGYSTFNREIDVKRNETIKINAELIRLEGELSIQVRPWGSIYINGELKKKSADIRYNIKLPVDEYNIKIEHPTLGYWQKSVKVQTGKTSDIVVNFTKKISVRIRAEDEAGKPVFADIYVDGENTGKKSPEQIQMRIGVRKITLKKDGYMVVDGEKEIFVDEDFNQQISFSLRKSG